MSEGGGGRTGVPFADEPTDVGRFEDDFLAAVAFRLDSDVPRKCPRPEKEN